MEKAGDKIHVAFFQSEFSVRKRKFGRSGADIINSYVFEIVHHIFPFLADIEKRGDNDVEFSRLKKIIKIVHNILLKKSFVIILSLKREFVNALRYKKWDFYNFL